MFAKLQCSQQTVLSFEVDCNLPDFCTALRTQQNVERVQECVSNYIMFDHCALLVKQKRSFLCIIAEELTKNHGFFFFHTPLCQP